MKRGHVVTARRLLLIGGASVSAYAAVLVHPQPLFAYAARGGEIRLHARQPLPAEAATVLADARTRVARSPFFDPGDTYELYLCDTSRLFAALALWDHNAGAVSQWLLTGNIFVRPAHVERDRLLGPSGREATGERTLAYFVAHEVTHTMVARRLGRLGYARLRAWQAEGYADYVAKAGRFDFAENLAAFKAEAPALDPHRSGLYLRYHLLVAYALEREGLTPERLLAGPIDEMPIEQRLKGL